MPRQLSGIASAVISLMPDEKNLLAWIVLRAEEYSLDYLLAFAVDGVIWGRRQEKTWVTSDQVQGTVRKWHAAAMDPRSLQRIHLFSDAAELLLWRDGENAWQARVIQDVNAADPTWTQCIDENYLLWGTRAVPMEQGFTLLEHGEQGFFHAIPGEVTGELRDREHAVALKVRHYISRQGAARIETSRLMGLAGVEHG